MGNAVRKILPSTRKALGFAHVENDVNYVIFRLHRCWRQKYVDDILEMLETIFVILVFQYLKK